MIKRPISEHDQWIVDEDNTVTGIAQMRATTIATGGTARSYTVLLAQPQVRNAVVVK